MRSGVSSDGVRHPAVVGCWAPVPLQDSVEVQIWGWENKRVHGWWLLFSSLADPPFAIYHAVPPHLLLQCVFDLVSIRLQY